MQIKGWIKIFVFNFIFIQLLLTSCISDNSGKSQNMLTPSDYFENDALKLAKAIEKGNLSEMNSILKSGLDVNMTGKHGMKFLFFALAQKQKLSLKLLLESWVWFLLKSHPDEVLRISSYVLYQCIN